MAVIFAPIIVRYKDLQLHTKTVLFVRGRIDHKLGMIAEKKPALAVGAEVFSMISPLDKSCALQSDFVLHNDHLFSCLQFTFRIINKIK